MSIADTKDTNEVIRTLNEIRDTIDKIERNQASPVFNVAPPQLLQLLRLLVLFLRSH